VAETSYASFGDLSLAYQGSRCLRDRLAYSARVDCLRPDAASVVARQCASHSPTVCDESRTGASSLMRSRASSSLSAQRHYEPVEFTLPDIGAAKPGPRSSTPPDPSTVTTRAALRPAPLSLAGALHHRPAQAELGGLPTAGMRARRSHLVESGVEDFLGE
jgi:hypothetical protein